MMNFICFFYFKRSQKHGPSLGCSRYTQDFYKLMNLGYDNMMKNNYYYYLSKIFNVQNKLFAGSVKVMNLNLKL